MPEEMTNQSIESTQPDSTPTTADDPFLSGLNGIEDTSDKPTEEEQDIEEVQEETPEPEEHSEPKKTFKVKFNGVEQDVSEADAIGFIQKGMNYDKVFNELQNYRGYDRTLSVINDLAKSAGVEADVYVQRLVDFQNNAMIQQISADLKEKYPDSPDELINQVAKERYEKMVSDKQRNEQASRQTKEDAEKAQLIRQVEALEKHYPDVDVFNLPAEVIQMAQQGETLLSAYRAYDLKTQKQKYEDLQKEIDALKMNQSNKNKSTGSLSKSMKNDEVDSFIAMLK